MEDRQLNYYQPLLSVRRSISPSPSEKDKSKNDDYSLLKISPLPSYKSELKSGPIRNAGTVPFVWEQCPGKPKDESKPRNRTNQSPVVAPKLPPGRIMEMRKQTSKHSSGSKHSKEGSYGLHSVSASNENEPKVESTQDMMEIEASDIREGDEEYLNAYSRTEPVFPNCSFSGTSELDGSSGNFSIDPQTRDFMMDRFLPAAKAMTSEAPRYVPRRQPVVQEQPRQMVKVVSGVQSSLKYGPNVEKEEESDDDYDVHGQLTAKACGLLPNLCLKGSFFLLNPLPGMRGRTRVQSTGGRTHGSSSSAGLCRKNENEKLEGSAVYRHMHGGRMPAPQNELPQPTFYAQKPLSSYDYELPRNAFSEQRGAFSNAVETGVSTNGKGFTTFKELLADPKSNEEEDTESPMVENTLNVDVVQKVESPSTYSYDSDMKGLSDSKPDVSKDFEKCKTVESTHSADFSDAEYIFVEVKEENMQINAQKHVDDLATTTKSEVLDTMNNRSKTLQSIKTEDAEKREGSYSICPSPPPLPKSPSDSWLSRTLPSIAPRTPPSFQAHIDKGIRRGNHRTSKTSSVNHKWETIVKSTRDHHRQEPLESIPET